MANTPECPQCEMPDVLDHGERWECLTCGHEWEHAPEASGPRIVKDAYGTILADGNSVMRQLHGADRTSVVWRIECRRAVNDLTQLPSYLWTFGTVE